MKNTPIFYLMILLLLPAFAFGQARQYPDSIRVELPDQGAIAIFELRVYAKDKDIILTFPTQLTEVLNHIKNSIPTSQLRDSHIVDVAPDKTDDEQKRSNIMITKNKEEVTRLRVEDTTVLELLPPGWEITIRTDRSVVHVYVAEFAELEAISKMNFQPVITYLATQEAFVNPARMGVFTRVVMQNEKISPAGTPGHRLPADMLGLHPGAGVGLAGDRFYPEFNFMTAIYLANRFSSNRQRIAAGYELKLFSNRKEENAFSVQPVSFITLSYGVNFSRERRRWTALGVGYMVHSKSDVFTGKTLKIFFESDIGSDKLNIVPELYLTGDFKKSVFGVKLNYKF